MRYNTDTQRPLTQRAVNRGDCMNTTEKDFYPSRQNSGEKILNRVDPVLYAQKSACSPAAALPAALSPAPISPADRARAQQYEHDGFIVIDDLLSTQETEFLQREAARLQTDKDLIGRDEVIVEPDSNAVRSIFNVQQFSSIMAKLVQDARLVGWARYLLNDDVYLHQSRLNFKPAFAGKEFYWHSDFETWHVEDGMPRMRAVSMSIALTENRPSNGSVMLIPGSQQHFVACAGETPEDHYKQSLRKQEYGVPSPAALTQLVEGNDIAVVTGRAGSVLLFDCNTMHGSAGNITPYARTNLFFVYNAVSNRLGPPFSGQKPRPDFIARRSDMTPITPAIYGEEAYRP